jgi:diamine N-acetyltransferase
VAQAAGETVNIEYIETDQRGLEQTCALREKLIEHHKIHSRHFSHHYASMPPAGQRNTELLEKFKQGSIRVDLARDRDSGRLVGYCISTISTAKEGEIQSIFVEEDYRNFGIGDAMMQKALRWMDEQGTSKRILGVGAGNEEVINFYRRFNFFPRTIILEQVEDKDR